MCDFLTKNLYWIIPLIITTVFSILTVILTVQNIKIMKHQEKLQNDAFCFQLFDRRLNVYIDIKKIIANIIADYDVSQKVIPEFLQKTRDVEFLFGKDVQCVCNKLYKTICELHTKQVVLNSERNKGKVDTDLSNSELELMDKISESSKELSILVKNYISFENYKTSDNNTNI